jgi:hypothetical protein
MKVEIKIVKNAFKYVTIALGILIMISLFHHIFQEYNKQDSGLIHIALKETTNNEYCHESSMIRITDLAVKSIMAFVAGCLFSEKKFIRAGVI